MKERPILFSAPMVRAILDGTKTKTRRAVKPQPTQQREGWAWCHKALDAGHLHTQADAMAAIMEPLCPCGQPGDRLWVRENGWEPPSRTARMMREGADTWAPYYYDADGLADSDIEDFRRWGFKRRPSIHMPRWASRITLEIISVRVERLKFISDEDALAEGIVEHQTLRPGSRACSVDGRMHAFGPVLVYRGIWESLHGADSWAANPWVWVVEFRRVEG